MPRRNNRDKRFDPRELNINELSYGYGDDNNKKPVRRKRRKDKYDKEIYRDTQ